MSKVIRLKKAQIREKLQNDKLGRKTAKTWHKLMEPYTPMNNGLLYRNVRYKPFQIRYYAKYANYMYEGKVYVDPQTGASGFLTDKGWRSRRDIRKIPTARSFSYNKTQSLYATDHWDIVAEKAGQKNKLYRSINRAMRSGKYDE